MPKLESRAIHGVPRLLRGAALVLLVGSGLASIVASGGGNSLAPEPQDVVFVGDPQIVFRADGSPIIAHREDIRRGDDVRAQLRLGTDVLQLGQLALAVGAEAGSHALAADASGNALSIHSEVGVGPAGARGCRSTAAAPQWDCTQRLGDSGRAAIAMTELGIGVALVDSSSTLKSVAHTGNGWSALQTISDTHTSGHAVVYGQGLYGYAMYRNTDLRLAVRRYIGLFDRWETPIALSGDQSTRNARLVLHRDAPGAQAMALWLADPSDGGPRIEAWRADASSSGDGGAGWFNVGPVPGSECAAEMDAAMEPTGDVLVAWICVSGANAGRVFASRYASGAWSVVPQEVATGAGNSAPIKVAVDSQGNGVAVWRGTNQLFAASMTRAGGWQAAQPIGVITAGEYQNHYNVAMSTQGRGRAVWVRDAGVDPREGTRLAQQEVGPLALALTVQRHTFGGERIPITLRLGSARTQDTRVVLTRALPTGSVPDGAVQITAGQTEVSTSLDSAAVTDFTNGRIEATLDGVTVSQPFTLMPEPSAMQVVLTPSAVLSGEATTLELRVLPGYPIAVDVQLDSNQAAVTVPAQVAASAGTVASGSVATLQITSAPIAAALSATVTARFRSASGAAPLQVFPNVAGQFLLNVASAGNGTVASIPAGIVCPGDCAEPYALNSVVVLTATPSAGASFTGWSRDCAGSAMSVSVTMAAARACTANFAPTNAVVLPVIVTQPQSQTVVAGTSATFSVVATGSNLVYQWQKNGVAIPGAGGPSFTIPNVGPANAGAFTVVVSNLVNGSALNGVTSSVAALNVVSATGWQNVGAPLSQVTSQRIVMAVDHSVASAPVIYAAIAEAVAGRIHLLVRRFDGTNWVLVGGGPVNADALVSNMLFTPALYIEATGALTVAWAENGQRVRVKQWNGSAWNLIGDYLSVDANAEVFSLHVTSFRGNLSAAWIEGTGGVGRMTVKRWEASSQQWSGGRILPSETAVIGLRLATDSGFALLAFVPQDPMLFAFEGPMRMLRETAFNVFTEPCPALPRPAPTSTSIPTLPNVNLGFGVARSILPGREPVVVYNNGEAVFALACRGGGWVALDGNASSGQFATIGPTGEDLIALTVAQREDAGVELAWSKQTRFDDGSVETTTQVLMNDSTGSALVVAAAPLILANSWFRPGELSLGFFLGASEPVLAGTVQQSGQPPTSRVLRYRP